MVTDSYLPPQSEAELTRFLGCTIEQWILLDENIVTSASLLLHEPYLGRPSVKDRIISYVYSPAGFIILHFLNQGWLFQISQLLLQTFLIKPRLKTNYKNFEKVPHQRWQVFIRFLYPGQNGIWEFNFKQFSLSSILQTQNYCHADRSSGEGWVFNFNFTPQRGIIREAGFISRKYSDNQLWSTLVNVSHV